LVGCLPLRAAYLTQLAPVTSTSLLALPGGRVQVRQKVTVHLAAGANEVVFPLPTGGPPPDEVRLRSLSGHVEVRAAERPAATPGWVRWELEAEAEGTESLLLTFPAPGLQWTMSYALRLAGADTEWQSWVRLVNPGAQDWTNVGLYGLGPAPLPLTLAAGADSRFPLATYPLRTCQVLTVYDQDRYGAAPVSLVRVPRGFPAEAGDFRALVLPPGKVEITRADAAPPLLADLPYTPRHAPVELSLGPAPELTVQRRLISSRQVNQRVDLGGRLVMYDLEENYEIIVANRGVQTASLILTDKLAGPGEVRDPSAAATPVDAAHVSFLVDVPAQGETHLTYQLLRTNLEP
jgi:hypothetical protein